jgi:hypothetical protein
MKNLVFKTNIVCDKSSTHFAMLSLWDNVTDFNYIFRFETAEGEVYKMTLSLYLGSLAIEADCKRDGESVFDTFYYRALWNEFRPTLGNNDVKTQNDLFKVFAGVVWASPVKMIEK